jgi:purine-binding chemotaxis protein CheW
MSEAVTLPPEQVAEEEPQVPTRRLLVFEVGGGAFACEMESFREIVPTQAMTRLPGAPNTVCGLINLRGTIVTVLDGGFLLGRPGYARTRGLILVVDDLERWIGIGVDDVRDIQDVPIDRFSAADAAEASQPGITGAVEIEEQRVLVLDIKAVVEQVIGQREAR